MVEHMRESGKTTTWMALASTLGMTDVDIKASIETTKNSDTESISGPMDASMKAIGAEEVTWPRCLFSIRI